MKIRNFTPQDYAGIVNVHSSLNIVWPERPRTPEGWAEADRHRHPKCKYRRWVVEAADGFSGGSVLSAGVHAAKPWRAKQSHGPA